MNQSDRQLRQAVDEAIEGNKTIRTLKSDVEVLKTDVRSLKFETHRLGVLIEDIYDKINVILETVIDSRKIMDRIENGEARLTILENDNKLIKSTVKHHSQQLKALNS